MAIEAISENRCFGGVQGVYGHPAESTACSMRFSVYLPPQAEGGRVPVVYWLSGLTCTEENFTTKAGAQRYAAEAGIAVVAPDTSPRGDDVADDEAYDFGQGAGFYVNATEEPWRAHYRMYDYVVEELPGLIAAGFPVDTERAGVMGHSMGGHGALVCGLRNPDRFRSISAFAPICAPMRCPWGEKALAGYLGPDRETWKEYDATELVRRHKDGRPILVDQGVADGFLAQQLKPDLLEEACRETGRALILNRRTGYDHSYYFIASFIGNHIRHHAAALGA